MHRKQNLMSDREEELGNDLDNEDDYSSLEQLTHSPTNTAQTFGDVFENGESNVHGEAPTFSLSGIKEYQKHDGGTLLIRDAATDIWFVKSYEIIAANIKVLFGHDEIKLSNVLSRIHQGLKVIIDHDHGRAFSPEMKISTETGLSRYMKTSVIEAKVNQTNHREDLQRDVQKLNDIYGLSSMTEL